MKAGSGLLVEIATCADGLPTSSAEASRVRVFMVCPGMLRGGRARIDTFVESQATALRASGLSVTLGVVDDRTSLPGILRNLRRLRREVAAAKATVVHAQYGTVAAAIAHRIRGDRALLVSFCGDDILGTKLSGIYWWIRGGLGRQISLFAARRATAIIVKSQNLKQALPRHLWRKCSVLPNGVDTDFFVPMERAEARRRLGWGPEPMILFNASSGDNSRVKNFPLAQAGVGDLRSRGHQAILVPISNATRQEILWMLNAADCLLVTSLHEGSPNIVKEAMACNLPIVSVPCGDVAERLVDAKPGRITAYDSREIGAALAEVLAAGVRSNGRVELQRQGLASSVITARLTELYRRVTAEGMGSS